MGRVFSTQQEVGHVLPAASLLLPGSHGQPRDLLAAKKAPEPRFCTPLPPAPASPAPTKPFSGRSDLGQATNVLDGSCHSIVPNPPSKRLPDCTHAVATCLHCLPAGPVCWPGATNCCQPKSTSVWVHQRHWWRQFSGKWNGGDAGSKRGALAAGHLLFKEAQETDRQAAFLTNSSQLSAPRSRPARCLPPPHTYQRPRSRCRRAGEHDQQPRNHCCWAWVDARCAAAAGSGSACTRAGARRSDAAGAGDGWV